MLISLTNITLGGLLIGLSWLISDLEGLIAITTTLITVYLFLPRIQPAMIMRVSNAQPLSGPEERWIKQQVRQLAYRAKLNNLPKVFVQRTKVANAFTTGDSKSSAIAISQGLFEILSPKEIIAVLAHEVAHLANKDIQRQTFGEVLKKLITYISIFGLVFNLALVFLIGESLLSILELLLFAFAPCLATLIQLAGSRKQEFAADKLATKLTRDAESYAAALQKIDRFNRGWVGQFLMTAKSTFLPNLFQTHPSTDERLAKLGFKIRPGTKKTSNRGHLNLNQWGLLKNPVLATTQTRIKKLLD